MIHLVCRDCHQQHQLCAMLAGSLPRRRHSQRTPRYCTLVVVHVALRRSIVSSPERQEELYDRGTRAVANGSRTISSTSEGDLAASEGAYDLPSLFFSNLAASAIIPAPALRGVLIYLRRKRVTTISTHSAPLLKSTTTERS